MNDSTAKTSAVWGGIEDAAGLLAVRIGAWNRAVGSCRDIQGGHA